MEAHLHTVVLGGAPKPFTHCRPLFRLSLCTGRRKALCIGINYVGQSYPVDGCVNDALEVHQFLMEQHLYPSSNTIVLTDDNRNPRAQPTQKNILNAMRWLVEGARANDALFVHYSGHGGRKYDEDGDELSGLDGVIYDDVLHDTLVKPLPSGCRLTAVFDSRHSGSILDPNYEVLCTTLCRLCIVELAWFHSDGRVEPSSVAPAFQQAKSTPADVVCFSGCKDDQMNEESVEGVAVGVMSYAILKVLKQNPQITYIDLLRGVREILKESQKPQLSASHEIDINLRFIMLLGYTKSYQNAVD